jgi:hypothetical protein
MFAGIEEWRSTAIVMLNLVPTKIRSNHCIITEYSVLTTQIRMRLSIH